jgi:hypothetical protein
MSKSYRLLFEVLNPHYFYRLSEGIEVRKVLKQKDHGSWIEKEEIWGLEGNTDDDTPISAAYNPSGEYLGDPEFAKTLAKKGIVQFEKIEPNHSACSIGFNPDEDKWYGWSHRAMYGFGVGSKCKKGDCGYTPEKGEWEAKTIEDAKQMAVDFAKGVS